MSILILELEAIVQALEAGSRNNTQNRTKHVKFMQLKLIKLFMKSIEQKKV
jgi:hypothetical protein